MNANIQEESMKYGWAANAISSSCTSGAWTEMVRKINAGVKSRIKKEGFNKFAELSELEQAAVVEREFFEVSFLPCIK